MYALPRIAISHKKRTVKVIPMTSERSELDLKRYSSETLQLYKMVLERSIDNKKKRIHRISRILKDRGDL